MLAPGTTKTSSEYATQVFLPYVMSQLQHASGVDVVFDEYLPDSLKAATRKKRGKCIRRRVEASSSNHRNWQAFLRIDENKVELFSFLAMKIAAKETEKQIVSTHRKDVICTRPRDVAGLVRDTHEEADTRMLLHVEDAVKQGYTKESVRTVDTDVVVLAVMAAQRLDIDELWVAFVIGRSFRFIAVHEIAETLGPDKCQALPFFHAFTGCDTVSCFGGRGKKTAWETWKSDDGVTAGYCALSATPNPTTIDECIGSLERFVVLFLLSHQQPVVCEWCTQTVVHPELHVFIIICIDCSDLFTRCLNYYTKHPMSLHLPVTLYCSMHFRRHGGGSRSGAGLFVV